MPELDTGMLAYGWLVGLGAGAAAGMLAATAGIGGGLIYVPVFYALMPAPDQGVAMQIMASMLAIVLTGVFSARSHYRLGHIHGPSVRHLLAGLIIGAFLGLWSTWHIPESWVLLLLAAIDLRVAMDYGRHIEATRRVFRPGRLLGASVPLGYVSGLLGIGGGTMLVPLLRRSLPLRQAVGTSAFCGVVMAGAAALLNLLLVPAWHSPMQQQTSFLLGALTGILMTVPKATRWAAGLHSRLDERLLRAILKAVFLGLASLLAGAALFRMIC